MHAHTPLRLQVSRFVTDMAIYSDEERKFSPDVIVSLLGAQMLHMTEFGAHLAKLVDARNAAAITFSMHLIRSWYAVEAEPALSKKWKVALALGHVLDLMATMFLFPTMSLSPTLQPSRREIYLRRRLR